MRILFARVIIPSALMALIGYDIAQFYMDWTKWTFVSF